MTRLNKEQLDELKKKYDTDTVWSWSRINTFANQPWEYMIRYLKRKRVDTSNVYTVMGTATHDIIQDYIEGKHDKEDMYDMFMEHWIGASLGGYEFMNENVERGYIGGISHYFKNIDYDYLQDEWFEIEPPIITTFENDEETVLFVGYADLITKDDDGKVVITDFKSSSASGFRGKKLEENSRQLKLYALGYAQMNDLPIEQMRIRYDMQRYVNVSYKQKNGRWSRPSLQERQVWVKSQDKRLRGVLSDLDYDIFDIDDMVLEAISNNNLDNMPQDAKDRFKVTNGYIVVDMTQEDVDNLTKWILEHVNKAIEKTNGDWEEEFPEPLDMDDDFYFNVLAPGLKKFSQTWREQQELKEALENPIVVNEDITIDNLFEDSDNDDEDEDDIMKQIFGD